MADFNTANFLLIPGNVAPPADLNRAIVVVTEAWGARALAARMEHAARTAQAFGTRDPDEMGLLNLESLCAAYGFVPGSSGHLFL